MFTFSVLDTRFSVLLCEERFHSFNTKIDDVTSILNTRYGSTQRLKIIKQMQTLCQHSNGVDHVVRLGQHLSQSLT